MPTNPPAFCYTLLPLLIAIAKVVAGGSWKVVIVGVNAIATAIAGVLTFRLAYRWISPLGAVAAAAGYLGSFETMEWSRFILTDSLYLGIATAALYLMITAVIDDSPQRLVAAAAVVVLALLTRPVAPLLLVPLAAVGVALWRMRRGAAAGVELRRLTLRFVAVMPLLLVAAAGAITFIVARHLTVPRLAYVVALYKSGAVIVGRPEMWTQPGHGFFFIMTTTLRRLFVFFSIVAPEYGPVHLVVNTVYYIPLYVSAIAGVAALLLRRGAHGSAQMVGCVMLVMAGAIWINHAIVILDFEWRYRLQVMPALLLLSAFGVTEIARVAFRPAVSRSADR